MEQLRLYYITDKYVRYLHSRDRRVQYNKDKSRPYVGVVLYVGEYRYFVPMESPKQNHANIKPGVHIMRIEGGSMGILGFNNMIPVHTTAVEPLDMNSIDDPKYVALLQRQISFINRNKADVLNHAHKTYYKAIKDKSGFLGSICCDFKKLEWACSKYDPSR